jgi:Cd2+/Zn2+-exporting ATPase
MRFLRDPQVLLTLLCGVFLILGFLNLHAIIPYLSVLCGAYFALGSAWESVKSRTVDVNILMVLAAIGAIAIGQALDAAVLLFLFSLSSTMESLAMARTKNAIEGLIRLRPDQAIRISDGQEEKVRVEELKLKDRIKIPPFESIPVDGTVAEGSSSVDQSAMTGESVPVHKSFGEKLLAGTRNLDQVLIMVVESTVGDSTLDKIVELVDDAQENKASGERISTWFGQRYTFFVIGAFAVSFVVRLGMGVESRAALYESLTLLVALSPCALVISVPATTLSALAWAAGNGMLVRGGQFIETAGRVDTVAVDKTGTLTHGRPRLVEICVCARSMVAVVAGSDGCTEEGSCWHGDEELSPEARRLLRSAAAAEAYASHPVALAINQAARDASIDVPIANEERLMPGLGVSATVDGQMVVIGQQKAFDDLEIPIPLQFLAQVDEFQKAGMTVTLLKVGDEIAALGFRDAPRIEVPDFLEEVRNAGATEVLMLSGDNAKTAKAIADEVGIARFQGALMPQDKAKVIEELVNEGKVVMMVGDGVNDAPPLAKASIGVAMGGLGSDIALNAADVVLMHDRLDKIPQLMRLGKKTNRIIRANLFFATGVITVLTVFSLIGKLPLPLAVLGHEGSTVLVILNGLRVLRGPSLAIPLKA